MRGPASETVHRAVHALVDLTRARFGRAEVHLAGAPRPLVLATFSSAASMARMGDEERSPSLGSARPDALLDVVDTGTTTVRLELWSRRADVELTFRDRRMFELLFQALSRLAGRSPLTTLRLPTLHEAVRDFQAKLVANALERAQGNIARAARELRSRATSSTNSCALLRRGECDREDLDHPATFRCRHARCCSRGEHLASVVSPSSGMLERDR